MSGKGQEINVQLLHIHRNVRYALCSVTDKDGTRIMGYLSKGLDVIYPAKKVGDVRDTHQLCMLVTKLFKLLGIQVALFVTFEKL